MIDVLQERIGYRFRDAGLLTLALTHPSVANAKSNQRLEFLGDAILGAVVARIVYDLYPEEKEGDLARRQAALVCGKTLTQVARDIALGDALQLGTSETQVKGQLNASNLEDALEALIGALYLDGGMQAAEAFIKPRWIDMSSKVDAPPKDAKTALQEWAQARGLPVPSYTLLDTSGLAHSPEFTIEVTIPGYGAKHAKAASKRMAEQMAANNLLEAVHNV